MNLEPERFCHQPMKKSAYLTSLESNTIFVGNSLHCKNNNSVLDAEIGSQANPATLDEAYELTKTLYKCIPVLIQFSAGTHGNSFQIYEWTPNVNMNGQGSSVTFVNGNHWWMNTTTFPQSTQISGLTFLGGIMTLPVLQRVQEGPSSWNFSEYDRILRAKTGENVFMMKNISTKGVYKAQSINCQWFQEGVGNGSEIILSGTGSIEQEILNGKGDLGKGGQVLLATNTGIGHLIFNRWNGSLTAENSDNFTSWKNTGPGKINFTLQQTNLIYGGNSSMLNTEASQGTLDFTLSSVTATAKNNAGILNNLYREEGSGTIQSLDSNFSAEYGEFSRLENSSRNSVVSSWSRINYVNTIQKSNHHIILLQKGTGSTTILDSENTLSVNTKDATEVFNLIATSGRLYQESKGGCIYTDVGQGIMYKNTISGSGVWNRNVNNAIYKLGNGGHAFVDVIQDTGNMSSIFNGALVEGSTLYRLDNFGNPVVSNTFFGVSSRGQDFQQTPIIHIRNHGGLASLIVNSLTGSIPSGNANIIEIQDDTLGTETKISNSSLIHKGSGHLISSSGGILSLSGNSFAANLGNTIHSKGSTITMDTSRLAHIGCGSGILLFDKSKINISTISARLQGHFIEIDPTCKIILSASEIVIPNTKYIATGKGSLSYAKTNALVQGSSVDPNIRVTVIPTTLT